MKFLKQTIATHQKIYVADITVEQGLITKIVRLKSTPNFNNVLLPGYIDVHTHGGYGFDFNDLKNSGYHLNFQKYINKIHSEGVTSVMATTVTCPMNDLNNIGKNIMNIQSHDVNNVIVG
jgi:N-acetylglucosamine-6-phosphate deacetylase